jgi:hypothetical protein
MVLKARKASYLCRGVMHAIEDNVVERFGYRRAALYTLPS